MQLPIVGAAYEARSKILDAQRCVNLYPEVSESGQGKSVAALIGRPGLRRLATLGGSGGIRGGYTPSTGNAIVVQGNSVYRVDSSWNATLCGTLLTSTGQVSIADNGVDAVIVDGSYGYVLTLATNALNQITDPDFYGADRVDYLDDYFIFNRPGTQQFYISGLGTTTFDALDFASAEGAPDKLVSLIVDHRELWLFGETSTEVFVNTGNADFPFERSGNTFIEHGCAAKHGVAKIDNTVFWLGKDKNGEGVIWRADGYTPRRISTHAIEYAIQNYSTIDDCVAHSYQIEGHSFVEFTFPTADATWTYDASTNLWHELAYREPTTGALRRHRANCHFYFSRTHVVGDWEDGRIYELDLDYYTDDGDPITAIRATAHTSDPSYKWIRFDRLQIDLETGVGLESGDDPQITLDWSVDGGRTFGNEHAASMGEIGEYLTRVVWRRLGRSRDRVFRVTITDPVKRVIVGATLDAVGGAT